MSTPGLTFARRRGAGSRWRALIAALTLALPGVASAQAALPTSRAELIAAVRQALGQPVG